MREGALVDPDRAQGRFSGGAAFVAAFCKIEIDFYNARRAGADRSRTRTRSTRTVARRGHPGARQCGKTTLARSLGGEYFDLEQPAERLRADLQWEELRRADRLVTFDEAQSWPELFERLRGAIDADRARHGRFLLLGSVSPALTRQVSESLAGRLSLVELSPLLWNELETDTARRRLWLCGGYPDGGVLTPRAFPHWQRDYLTLLTQRDLPTWGLPAKPQTTERLLRMLAALHGQVWNASQVGQSLGLSYHTVNAYLDFLVGAFLIRRLPPYSGNIRKRLVKSPRVYWRDTGLLHALLNTPDDATLLGQPWVGASWEGFVIEQALGALVITRDAVRGLSLPHERRPRTRPGARGGRAGAGRRDQADDRPQSSRHGPPESHGRPDRRHTTRPGHPHEPPVGRRRAPSANVSTFIELLEGAG